MLCESIETPDQIKTQQLLDIANTPFSQKTLMARARKSYEAPARPRSTRTSPKTAKQQALEAANRNKQARKQKASPRAPSLEPIVPSPQRYSSLSSCESTPEKIEIDVSKVQYELNISCFLDQTSIITRVKHVILGEYKLQDFLADTIKTIAHRARKQKETISWDTGRAELRHRGLKRMADFPKNDVFDHSDWEEVEKALKAWMTKKALDIRVDLSLHFKTIELDIQPTRNASPSSSTEDVEMSTPQANNEVPIT